MATVKIWKICAMPEKAFQYGQKDKKEKINQSEIKNKEEKAEGYLDAFGYAVRDKDKGEIVFKTISSGINCTPESAVNTSECYRALYLHSGKRIAKTKEGNEVLAWHCEQSFEESPEQLPPQKAHEIGVKFAREMFGDFPCVVSTHCNTEHIHNHFVFGAYGADGKKYNQCNKQYQKMRECSDRLCEENGLSVLEKTKKQKLVRYYDDSGKLHYFEPTERKENLHKGKFQANDYRNSDTFEASETLKKNNRMSIKEDIDELIQIAVDYEDLLFCLRNLGYEIRDKKQDGTWMKHIAFKAPGQEKATRDYKISEDGFYTRENLEKEIKRRRGHIDSENDINITPEEAAFIIRKAESLNREAYGMKNSRCADAIVIEVHRNAGQLEAICNTKDFLDVKLAGRRRYLYDQINKGFDALHFVEKNKITSFDQLESLTLKEAPEIDLRDLQNCLKFVRKSRFYSAQFGKISLERKGRKRR